jgi:RimJ/RimL family protein N-acetyltransferase
MPDLNTKSENLIYQLVRINDDPEKMKAYFTWEINEDEKELFCYQDFNSELAQYSEERFLQFQKHFKETLAASAYYLLQDKQTGQYIGFVSLRNFIKRNRSAEVSFAMFNDFRGKGLGSIMLSFFLAQVFEKDFPWLHKIYGETSAFNIRSSKVMEKYGFQKDGNLRDHYSIKGKFYDQYLYSLLRSEWETGRN